MTAKEHRIAAALLAVSMTAGYFVVQRLLENDKTQQMRTMRLVRDNLTEQQNEAPAAAPPVQASTPVLQNPADKIAPTVSEQAKATEKSLAEGKTASRQALAAMGLLSGEERKSLSAEAGLMTADGKTTLAALIDFMQNKSNEAGQAEQRLAAETALAQKAEQGEQRSFSISQADKNYLAAKNLLAQNAVELGVNYLRMRDVLSLYEEMGDRLQNLRNEIAAATSDEQQQPIDQTKLEEQIAALQKTQEEKRPQIEEQVRLINAAVGNAVTARFSMEDKLVLPTAVFDEQAVVASGLEKRNELLGAGYAIVRQQSALTEMRYEYAENSPEIAAAQAELDKTKGDFLQKQLKVEAELRNMVSEYRRKTASVKQLEQTIAKIEQSEAYRAGYRQLADGACTIDDVLEAYTNIASARQEWRHAAAELNLLAAKLTYASGVGTTTVEI